MRHWINLVESHEWAPSEDEIDYFCYGGCNALSLALNRLTGLQMVALMEPSDEHGQTPVHMMNAMPDGRFVDVYGVRSYDEVIRSCTEEHGCRLARYWDLIDVSEKTLRSFIRQGMLDRISPRTSAAAKAMAKRIVIAFDLPHGGKA